MSGVTWRGWPEIDRNLQGYGIRLHGAALAAAHAIAPVLENYAKQTAPWTDRTANARQSLNAFVGDVSRDAVVLYLAHGMDYGKYLETRWAGRYAVLWPTVIANIGEMTGILRGHLG